MGVPFFDSESVAYCGEHFELLLDVSDIHLFGDELVINVK